MPIYEYLCKKCQKTFETLVTSSDTEEQVVCRLCGGTEVKKTLSAFSCGNSTEKKSAGGGLQGCSAGKRFT